MPPVALYSCRGCNMPPRTAKWHGPCPGCGGFWTIVRGQGSDEGQGGGVRVDVADGDDVALCDVSGDVPVERRYVIGGELAAIDDMLGGGFVEGTMVLLAGPAGIGKSTLTLQILRRLALTLPVLYVVGEESIPRVARRAQRIGKFPKKLRVLRETNLDAILDRLSQLRPKVAVIDSVAMIACASEASGDELEIGSAMSVRTTIRALGEVAMREGITFILIGHVTRDGAIGGPNTLDHLVDTVMYFDGAKEERARTLGCPNKNRDGETGPNVLVRLNMGAKGLTVAPPPEPLPKEPAKPEGVTVSGKRIGQLIDQEDPDLRIGPGGARRPSRPPKLQVVRDPPAPKTSRGKGDKPPKRPAPAA